MTEGVGKTRITHFINNGCFSKSLCSEKRFCKFKQFILFYAHFKGICALLSAEKMILVNFMSISCKKMTELLKNCYFCQKIQLRKFI